MKFFNNIFLLILLTNSIFSIVNTESIRSKSQKKGINHTFTFSGEINSGNNNYYSIKPQYRLDYLPKNTSSYRLLLVANMDFKKKDKNIVKDNRFVHFRYIRNLAKDKDLDYFIQSQSDFFKNLLHRELYGISYRKNMISKNKLSLWLGLGLMYEIEELKNNGTDNDFRFTNNLSINYILSDTVTISSFSYYQPNLDDFSDYRLLSSVDISSNLTKTLILSVNINFDFDTEPGESIEKFDTKIKQSVSYLF